MTVEYNQSSPLEIFERANLPELNSAEIIKYTTIINNGRVVTLPTNDNTFLHFPRDKANILLTGMPRFGKSTVSEIFVRSELVSIGFPINIVPEVPPEGHNSLLGFEHILDFNLAFANLGLVKIQNAHYSNEEQINIFQRSFIDHLVFIEASMTLREIKNPRYYKAVEAFKNYFGYFTHMIDGIIVCNSTAETAMLHGSTTEKPLLEELSLGYQKFPKIWQKLQESIQKMQFQLLVYFTQDRMVCMTHSKDRFIQ